MRRSSFHSALIPRLLNVIFPSVCPLCSSPTDSIGHAPFCRACWSSISQYTGPSCRVCGVALVSVHSDRCRHCLEDPPAYRTARSFAYYDGVIASAIHHFKFMGLRRLAAPLSQFLLHEETGSIDAVLAVPLSLPGLRRRGYNQALLLADRLAKKRRIPLLLDLLRKDIDTPPQVGLSAKERAANVMKAFSCRGSAEGKKLLLIDDVMTTGATVNACAKALLEAGAESVSVLTLARAGMLR